MRCPVKYLALVLGVLAILISDDARSQERYNAFGTRCSVYVKAYDKAVQKSMDDNESSFKTNFEPYWGFISGWVPRFLDKPRYDDLDVRGLTAWIASECRDQPNIDLTDIMTILTDKP